MKRLTLITVAVLSVASTASADYVGGYYKKNGTYVEGYHRTHQDSYRSNNYSSKGNYNPYTGKQGTRTYGDCSYSSAC